MRSVLAYRYAPAYPELSDTKPCWNVRPSKRLVPLRNELSTASGMTGLQSLQVKLMAKPDLLTELPEVKPNRIVLEEDVREMDPEP